MPCNVCLITIYGALAHTLRVDRSTRPDARCRMKTGSWYIFVWGRVKITTGKIEKSPLESTT